MMVMMGFAVGELGSASKWTLVLIQMGFLVHEPAIRFWSVGQLPIPFVVLNGYLVLVLVLMLATSLYRAIRWWLTRP